MEAAFYLGNEVHKIGESKSLELTDVGGIWYNQNCHLQPDLLFLVRLPIEVSRKIPWEYFHTNNKIKYCFV